MNRSSIFGLKIDFEKSQGSYLYDKFTDKKYLDFFGQYSTLALGYNHPIFKSSAYQKEIKLVSHQKITNCEIFSSESEDFDRVFREYTSKDIFTHYHYSCTGALAIESAIKTAIDYKGKDCNRVISFKKSFHGINSYGGIYTDRSGAVGPRLNGFPGSYWDPIDNPVIKYDNGKKVIDEAHVSEVIDNIEKILRDEKKVCAILLEPIQCTHGDNYFPDSFFIGIRNLCNKYDIPLIFDEIQIGFGATGKLWYFEHLPIIPDILVFGKKTQLSGIAVQEKFAKIFDKSIRLEVTWDSDLMDMVRCKHIIRAYEKYDILENVLSKSKVLISGLKKISAIENLRSKGLIVGFDLENGKKRRRFMEKCKELGFICNPTGEISVRLRPNLAVSENEILESLEIIDKVCNKI